ncbi:hypothetical protein BASA81_017298 [Batrachochytrium salamandrivorans]|nr:hypothetical protein BASA81_017298 [Batrachochytrium salamandrivorans]
MEYLGEDWMDLDEYMTKHGKVSMDKARLIIKEVVTALLSLKKLGILHGDVLGRNILYNGKTGGVKLIDFGITEPLEGWNQDNSAQARIFRVQHQDRQEDRPKVRPTEIRYIKNVGYLLYLLLTSGDHSKI